MREFKMFLWFLFMAVSLSAKAVPSDKYVTLDMKNVSMETFLEEVKKQTSISILYNAQTFKGTEKISVKANKEPWQTLLKRVLASRDFVYNIKNDIVVIRPAKSSENQGPRKLLGKVVDENGEPMIGATVTIKRGNESVNTITDLDGNFTADNNGNEESISVSFIGYETSKQLVRGNKTEYTFHMVEDSKKLDELVVTGYQVIDRRKLTASISSVKMEDALMPEMTTIDQALEGRIPDLMYMQNSGEVGATARLRVRGTSTLVGNREPLWVLDGFILQDPVNVSTEQLNDPDYINYIGNAISGINPQDIERIDVLKDAAATALYGTRAANGVIVVTTKKGQVGSPSIRYSNSTKLSMRPRYSDSNINVMNSQERVQFGKDLCDLHYVFPQYMPMVGYEGAYYKYMTNELNYNEFLKDVQWYETTNTDWFKLLCQDAITHAHTLSVSGGSTKAKYYASVGYTREDGTVKTEYVDRYTATMNLTSELSKNLKMNLRMNGNIQKKNHLPSDVKVLNYAYETTRALPAYNTDGTLYYYNKHGYSVGNSNKANSLYQYNILNEMDNTSNDYSGNTFATNGELIYKLKDFANITLAAAYSRSSTLQSTWYGEKSNYVAILKNGEVNDVPQTGSSGKCELPYGGVYNTTNTITESLVGRAQANIHYAFGETKSHLITSTIGYEVSAYRSNGISDQTRGFYKERGLQYATMEGADLDSYPDYKNWLAKGHRTLTAGKTNTISGYFTIAYDYKSYFTLGLNGRFDASNKFGSRSNEKFLPVWAASGKWNIKETLFKENTTIDDWGLRVSYGKTGNMLDNETPNLLVRRGTMDSFYGENISSISAYPNPNLRWEQTATTNFGTDLSLFRGRLMLTGELWFKHTTDAYSTINIATVNGRSSYRMNNGTIDNYGFSINLSGYPIRTKDWKLFMSTNYSWASNTVKSGTNDNFSLDDYLNGTAIVDNAAIGTFYSYKYLGLNPNTGIPIFEDHQDHRHLLANKKLSEIIPLVMTETGNRYPKLNGSFYTTLTWKQLSMNMNFNYRIGCKVRLFNLYTPISSGVSSDKNVRKEFVDRWTKPGDELYTNIPALLSPSDPNYEGTMSHWSNSLEAKMDKIPVFAGNTWQMYDMSDLRVVSGDFLRLSSLMLSYQFTMKQLQSTFLKSLRLSLSMSNVFTIASDKLNGQDPTQASSTAINMSLRPAYTFGLNVSF